jgi:hypothetical protein
MAVRKAVLEAFGVMEVSIGEAVIPGDLLYWNSTNSDFRLADADVAAISNVFPYPRLIAMTEGLADGDVVMACVEAILFDGDDNGFSSTADDALYMDDTTAGGVTTTRPTGANDLKIRVGTAIQRSGGTGAQYAHLKLEDPREVTINLSPITDGTAVFAQNLDFTGVLLGAASEAAGYTFMVPENATGRLVIAYLWWTNGASAPALDASDTYTVDVSAGVDDETNSASSDGILAAALTIADNDLNRVAITAALDVAGIIEPGNIVGIDVDKAAEGASGDDPLMLGAQVILETVN